MAIVRERSNFTFFHRVRQLISHDLFFKMYPFSTDSGESIVLYLELFIFMSVLVNYS